MLKIKQRFLVYVTILICVLVALGCGDESSDATTPSNSNNDPVVFSTGPEIPGEDLCGQEYSVCGSVRIPANFEGQPVSLAVGLYREPTPAGSPDVVLTQIDAPSIAPGETYPIRVYPFLSTGEFYLWTFVYVEGGGTNRPVNGVDYMGRAEMIMNFDGQALEFESVDIEPASGW